MPLKCAVRGSPSSGVRGGGGSGLSRALLAEPRSPKRSGGSGAALRGDGARHGAEPLSPASVGKFEARFRREESGEKEKKPKREEES